MLLLCTSTACIGEFDSRFPDQVRDSSEESKRSFLVSKGLTEEEIEAAFIRVGPTSSASDVKGGLSTPPKPWEKGGAMVPAPPAKKPIRWTQVVLGAGAAAGGLYMAKVAVAPYVEKLVKSFLSSKGDNDEIKEEQKRVDTVVSELAERTSELQNSVQSLTKMFLSLEDSISDYKSVGNAEEVTEMRSELKSLASTINQFASPGGKTYESALKDELSAIKSILSDIATSPQPGQGMGEFSSCETTPVSVVAKEEGIGSSSRVDQNGLGSVHVPSQAHSEEETPSPTASRHTGGHDGQAQGSNSKQETDVSPRPHSYMEILEMLEKNQTPPGIRTDIDDKVKVPNQNPTKSSVATPPAKPWVSDGAGKVGLKGIVPLHFGEEQDSGLGPSARDTAGVDGAVAGERGWRPPPLPVSRLTAKDSS